MKTKLILIMNGTEKVVASFTCQIEAWNCANYLQARVNDRDLQYAIEFRYKGSTKRSHASVGDFITDTQYLSKDAAQRLRMQFAPIQYSTHKV